MWKVALLFPAFWVSVVSAGNAPVDWRGGVTSYPDAILDLDPSTAVPDTLTVMDSLGVDCTVTLLAGSSGYIAGDSDKDWGNDSLEALFGIAGPGTHLYGPRHAMAGGSGEKHLRLTFTPTTYTKYLFIMDVDMTDYIVVKDEGGSFLSPLRFLGTCDNEHGNGPLSFTFGAQYNPSTGTLTCADGGNLNEPVSVFDITGLDTVLLTASGSNQFAVGISTESISNPFAYNPKPASGQQQVFLDTDLYWEIDPSYAYDGIPAFKLYLTDDPGDPGADHVAAVDLSDPHYDPGTLFASKQYFWRVDVMGDSNTYRGVPWNFTTVRCSKADITGDCKVDMEDVVMLSTEWLTDITSK